MARRCNYCRLIGHTYRTCDKVKQDAPYNGWAESLLRKADQKRAMLKEVKRACSFCKEMGHNKTSCQNRRLENQNILEKSSVCREHFRKWIVQNGYGIGALVKITNLYPDYGKEYVGMIIDIHADNVGTKFWHQVDSVFAIKIPENGKQYDISLPESAVSYLKDVFKDDYLPYYHYGPKMSLICASAKLNSKMDDKWQRCEDRRKVLDRFGV
jgi:hypothetical protein